MATGSVTKAEVAYLDSDGQPVAETDLHRNLLLTTVARLRWRYAGRTDVYVSGNLFVYYEEGVPQRNLAPDCFVVFGVPGHDRRLYKVWEEGGRFPSVVIEFTSVSTHRDDLHRKFSIYEHVWRVDEYFLFDPYEEYLDSPLMGYRRRGDRLLPIKPVGGNLTSKKLGVTLERDGEWVRLRDAVTGQPVYTEEEENAVRAQENAVRAQENAVRAQENAARERELRLSAEAENARLKAELDALRRKKS